MASAQDRREQPSIEQLLDAEQDAFDHLMADVRGGIRSSVHFDELEERAARIARNIRDAFRRGAR